MINYKFTTHHTTTAALSLQARACIMYGALGHFFRPGGERFTTVLKTDIIPSKIECTLTKCCIDGIIIHVVFVFVVENIYRNASRLVYRCVNTEKQIYLYIFLLVVVVLKITIAIAYCNNLLYVSYYYQHHRIYKIVDLKFTQNNRL